MMGEAEFNQAIDDEWNSDTFRHGMSVGVDLGHYEATEEAIRAYEAGEIDLWIEFNRPKSFEEWDAWEAEHGTELSERWKAKRDGT